MERVKKAFKNRRVLQFTATPFREDGQPLDGKIIFTYPLRKAQEEEYFKPIRFRRVVEFDERRADEAIARAAIEQLQADADKGHILMARAENVERAKQVFAIYARYPNSNPFNFILGSNPSSNGLRIEGLSSARNHASSSAWTCSGKDLTSPNSKSPPFTTSGKRSR
jgi:superfamily II DNA or RNA helicase